ncbi:MAG: NUDIX domain-containing protein [Candidatus Hodarchaeales archaeon]
MKTMFHAADGILVNPANEILLIKRKSQTFYGYWAIPGGGVEEHETVEEALIREMKEEVNVNVTPREILGVFSDPKRDPRGRIISTVFICDYKGIPQAGSDASEVKVCSVQEALSLDLAFDHNQILRCFQKWLQNRRTYWSSLEL